MSWKLRYFSVEPPSWRVNVPVDSLLVGEASFSFSTFVKTIGVTLDTILSFDQHVSAVVKSSLLSCQIFEQSSFIPHCKTANNIVVWLTLSKLDYCNSLLAGLPQTQIKRLHAAQNIAARTVAKCRKTNHITPIVRKLHRQPVHDRIHHKVLSATYLSVHGNVPLYLS